MTVIMEIEFEGESRYVHEYTEERCRKRADELYGKDEWKFVQIDETGRFLCQT